MQASVSAGGAKTFPRAWAQCSLALAVVVVGALDLSGYAVRGGLLLAGLAVLTGIVIEAVLLSVRLSRHGWRGAVPILALIGAVPLAYQLGDAWIAHRFETSKSAYASVANEVMSGTYPAQMRTRDAALGRWAKPIRADGGTGRIEGVEFAVISYGFAGHVGYVYLTDDDAERDHLTRRPPGGWTSWDERWATAGMSFTRTDVPCPDR